RRHVLGPGAERDVVDPGLVERHAADPAEDDEAVPDRVVDARRLLARERPRVGLHDLVPLALGRSACGDGEEERGRRDQRGEDGARRGSHAATYSTETRAAKRPAESERTTPSTSLPRRLP